MTPRTALRIGLLLWTIAFILSFLDTGLTGPSGDGFTAGMNKITSFLIWQGLALIFAIGVWVVGSRFERRSSQRVSSRIPGIVTIAMGIAFGLFIASSGMLNTVAGGADAPAQPRSAPTEPTE